MEVRKQKIKALHGITLHSLECSVSAIDEFSKMNQYNRIVWHMLSDRKDNDKWTFSQYGAENSIKNILDGNARDFNPPEKSNIGVRQMSNSVKRRKTYDEIDGELSVDMVLNGSMKPYRRKKKVPSKQRNLTIYISLIAGTGSNGDVLAYFAREASKKIYEHVSSGAMVTVYYVFCVLSAYENDDSFIYRTKIKEANKPVDYRRIACLSYPAYIRYFSFMASSMINREENVSERLGNPIGGVLLKRIIHEHYNEDNFILYDFMHWSKNDRKLSPVEETDLNYKKEK